MALEILLRSAPAQSAVHSALQVPTLSSIVKAGNVVAEVNNLYLWPTPGCRARTCSQK